MHQPKDTMRFHLPLVAIALLGGTVVAQTHQEFELRGSQTSFTSRGSLGGPNAGELLQGFHASHFVGLAENNGNNGNHKCEITQLITSHQDQNCASREKFDFVVRGGSDTTGPDGSSAAIIGEVKGLRTPASTRTGACAFITTVTLAASARIKLNCPSVSGTTIKRDFFAVGLRMTSAPNWTTDGHSLHTSFGTAATPDQNSWTETVATGGPTHSWQIIGTATASVQAADYRTWCLGWGTHGVTMMLGCGGAYGTGGMFPRSSPNTAPLTYSALLRGGTGMAGASSVVILSLSLFPAILPLGSGARIYVSTASMTLFFGRAATGRGEVIIYLAPYIPLLGLPTGTKLPFQGALDHASTGLRLSNAQFCEPK